MEILIICIIIAFVCMILGIGLNYLLYAMFVLFCLVSAFFALFFLYSVICLLCSKRKEARFIRFEKPRNSKYQAAYYLVDDAEYSCVFPREGILNSKLYKQDRIYHVMLNRRMKKVFDRFAIVTCILGFVFWSGLSVAIILSLV